MLYVICSDSDFFMVIFRRGSGKNNIQPKRQRVWVSECRGTDVFLFFCAESGMMCFHLLRSTRDDVVFYAPPNFHFHNLDLI